jgi:hypothetical protein
MKMKHPKVGDRIKHNQIELDKTSEGVVTYLLSGQFMYVTDENITKYCLYKEIWEVVNEENK